MFNKTKVKTWIKKQATNCLTIDFENMLITDGYVLFKINEEMKDILNSLLITESVSVRSREKQSKVMDLSKILKPSKNYTFKVEDSKMNYVLKEKSARIFIKPNEENMYIDLKFIEMFSKIETQNIYASELYFDGIMIKDMFGEFVALLLPLREPDVKYKLVLNEN